MRMYFTLQPLNRKIFQAESISSNENKSKKKTKLPNPLLVDIGLDASRRIRPKQIHRIGLFISILLGIIAVIIIVHRRSNYEYKYLAYLRHWFGVKNSIRILHERRTPLYAHLIPKINF